MRLILGTANFGADYGKRLERDECHRILDRAKELGIWALDTAPSYGDSEMIIRDWLDWGRVLPVFSKATSKLKNTIGDYVLHHEADTDKVWGGYDGISVYNLTKDVGKYGGWVQAPFNLFNFEFLPICSKEKFIARSIFLGGKYYPNVNPEFWAMATFRFLLSHRVPYCVFGVESVEELEFNCKMFRIAQAENVDTRKL